MDLPLGDGRTSVSLPDCDVTIRRPPGGEAVDVRAAAETAVGEPHGRPLAERVDPGDDVAIVVTDVTRATPDGVLVDVLLSELAAAGVDRECVTVVVGLGLHRPLSEAELVDTLGEHADLAINHDPTDTVVVGEVSVPARPDGDSGDETTTDEQRTVRVAVHRAVADADAVLSTGMVEPHQYAGFSGGAKTAAIGAGGESLIRFTHGPSMLARDGVRLGRIEDNPFRETVDRAGDLLGLAFCVNVTHTPAGVLGASAGDHRAVVSELAGVARKALSVSVTEDETYDAVVAGVGAPKDANLYQASRAATYVALGDRNPLRPGGRIVIPAELPEGAGEGTGERRFYERLAGADDAASLYERMRSGYDPGAQRAFVVARVLREYDVVVTNSRHPAVVERCLMDARETVADAVAPGSDVLVVPDALHTLLVRPRK